jgi:hypothetical protein
MFSFVKNVNIIYKFFLVVIISTAKLGYLKSHDIIKDQQMLENMHVFTVGIRKIPTQNNN